jgi:hypothetical protein
MLPLAELQAFAPKARRTFSGSDDVLCVVQYWLEDVQARADVLDEERLRTDAVYARHVGQLNVLTFLIEHADSNLGNILVSADPEGARLFAIDNGVAFSSEPSNRGELWRTMRVQRLPADTVARLRALTQAELAARLGVLAQWRLENRRYVASPLTDDLDRRFGVRRKGGVLQMGLTQGEIANVWKQRERLLELIDKGKIVAGD